MRRTPLTRLTPLRVKWVGRPARTSRKLTAAERETRSIVAVRSGGWCETRIPGVCLGRATNMQHRKNRSQGGKWCPTGILHCCGSGTTGCHGYMHASPAVATEAGWTVRSTRDPATVPVRLHQGWVLLDTDGGWTNLGAVVPVEYLDHAVGCSSWGRTPDGVTPLAPVPTDSYSLVELIEQEDHDLPMGHAFPDLYARLKAQEGYELAARTWGSACAVLAHASEEESG